MLRVLKTRLEQKKRTTRFPEGDPPPLSPRFAGRPSVVSAACPTGCGICAENCPTGAIAFDDSVLSPQIDTGRCLFCRACERACPNRAIQFGKDYALAAAAREDLKVDVNSFASPSAANDVAKKIFGRSLKLRQVSAGGCNACEADCNVLTTPVWDIGRFGIQFVASPRHADGLLITGPVTENMRLAVQKTYAAVPDPKIVIAMGACAISGGLYRGRPEQHDGAESIVPVDLYIPGCPPHPLTILDGLLRFVGRIDEERG